MSAFDYQLLNELLREGSSLALCTVIGIKGSTPRKLGAKMLVQPDGTPYGTILGTIGGGAIEHLVRAKALEIIKKGTAEVVEVALASELGMCCGGQMSIFIEPLENQPHLIVLGAGHIGLALSRLGLTMDFQVTLADPRQDLLDASKVPDTITCFEDYTAFDLEKMPFGHNTFVVVVTHDHRQDQELIEKFFRNNFIISPWSAQEERRDLQYKGASIRDLLKNKSRPSYVQQVSILMLKHLRKSPSLSCRK